MAFLRVVNYFPKVCEPDNGDLMSSVDVSRSIVFSRENEIELSDLSIYKSREFTSIRTVSPIPC